MKIKFDYSPNFSSKSRHRKDIKFVIIHYTGMQSEIESINRLKNPKFKVSCHYLINRKGEIIQMVKDKNIAWHAGKSRWKKFLNLNKNSIGIELVNKGHKYGYQNYQKKQIKSLIRLCKFLKRKYSIKKENFLGHSDISPHRKIDPGERFPWKEFSSHSLGKWYIEDNYHFRNSVKKIDTAFFKNLKKLGYRYFSVLKRNAKDKWVIRSFQQHYLPDNVTGKIDEKTFKISYFLTH
ncbi:N-acetylmuramoyl-L-alanine amidase [Candidatus Pelagibacter bacterium]|nr:N-acetylmuramoyl-L-alanine amidase [Candidatus Pelagibacter bacterium]